MQSAAAGSALDWIQRSRTLEQQRQLDAEREAAAAARKTAQQVHHNVRTFVHTSMPSLHSSVIAIHGMLFGLMSYLCLKQKNLPRYAADALAGMKVRHDTNELDKGEEVVLTLKDDFIIKDGVCDQHDA